MQNTTLHRERADGSVGVPSGTRRVPGPDSSRMTVSAAGKTESQAQPAVSTPEGSRKLAGGKRRRRATPGHIGPPFRPWRGRVAPDAIHSQQRLPSQLRDPSRVVRVRARVRGWHACGAYPRLISVTPLGSTRQAAPAIAATGRVTNPRHARRAERGRMSRPDNVRRPTPNAPAIRPGAEESELIAHHSPGSGGAVYTITLFAFGSRGMTL